MRFLRLVLLPLILFSEFASGLTVEAQDKTELVSPVASRFAPMANPFFAREIEFQGRMGDDKIRMHLQPKTEDRDSVEGSYVVAGGKRNQGKKIFLAGEVSGNKLSMEESEDGVDVSGQWDGELKDNVIRGIWQSDDGKVSKEFVLELLPVSKKPTKSRTSK
ncbi:hypothetical protein DFR42_101894 [Undibacterium pigrum]|uniref:Uncharacterized protein n=1 Tax=Undibacterium pigrum TaxID=401470 RepID=A0A318JFD3_9BURK|nr:hypothetical protein DFR42_101894 [Undibacterium pigrum]